MTEETVLTVKQVAEYLQLKQSTVYTWAQEGKIPAVKVGRSWQFNQSELERWIEKHLVTQEKARA